MDHNFLLRPTELEYHKILRFMTCDMLDVKGGIKVMMNDLINIKVGVRSVIHLQSGENLKPSEI